VHPGGHFYSPIVDPADAAANAAHIWPEPPAEVAGIDFDDASHRHVLATLFPRFYPGFDYVQEGAKRLRVVFGCANAYFRHREALVRALGIAPEAAYGGGSLWLEVAG
ncbi:MAG TPA: hypothetical protein VHE32_02500, partial [Rhodanobacteraceae bacterium]|nr:hypothetical protein [Rhodanobacteraceae bacterium]